MDDTSIEHYFDFWVEIYLKGKTEKDEPNMAH